MTLLFTEHSTEKNFHQFSNADRPLMMMKGPGADPGIFGWVGVQTLLDIVLQLITSIYIYIICTIENRLSTDKHFIF